MGFLGNLKDKVKNVFNGGDDKKDSGGNNNQGMSKAPSSGDNSFSDISKGRTSKNPFSSGESSSGGTYDPSSGTYTSPGGQKQSRAPFAVPEGTKIETGGSSGSSSSRSSSSGGTYDPSSGTYTGSQGKQSRAISEVPEGTKIQQRTTQTQAQQTREKFEQKVFGRDKGSYDPSSGTYTDSSGRKQSRAPSTVPEGTRIKGQQSTFNKYFGTTESQQSKTGTQPTQVSEYKATGWGDFKGKGGVTFGQAAKQTGKNIIGMPKDFLQGKRGEELYGGIFAPFEYAGQPGAQERVIVNKQGDVVFSNPDQYSQKVIDNYLKNNPGTRLTTKGKVQDIARGKRETQYEEKVDKLTQNAQKDIQKYRASLQKQIQEGKISPQKAEESFKTYQNKKIQKFKQSAKNIKVDEKLPYSKQELITTKGEELKEGAGIAADIGVGFVGGPAAVGYFTGKGAVKASKAREGIGDASITGSTISPSETEELTFYFGAGAVEGGQYLKNIQRGIVADDLGRLSRQPIRYKGIEFRGADKSTLVTKGKQKYLGLTREFDIYGDVVKTGEGKITTMPSGRVTTRTSGKLPFDPKGGSGRPTKVLSQQEFTVGSKSQPVEALGEGFSVGQTKLFPKARTSLTYETGKEADILTQLKKGRGKWYKKTKSGFEKISGDSFEKTYGLTKSQRVGKGDFGGELYESGGVGVTQKGKFTAPTTRGTTEVIEIPTSETTGFSVLGPGRGAKGTKGVSGKSADEILGAGTGKGVDDVYSRGTTQGRSVTGRTPSRYEGTGLYERTDGAGLRLKADTQTTQKTLSPKTVDTTDDILRKTARNVDTTAGLKTGKSFTSGLVARGKTATETITNIKGNLKTGIRAGMKGKTQTRADMLSDLRSNLRTESDIMTRTRSDADLRTYTQPTTRTPSPRLRTSFGSGVGVFGFPTGSVGFSGRSRKAKKTKLKGRKTQYAPSVTALSLGITGKRISGLYKAGGGGLGLRPIIEKKKNKKKKKRR